jgi:hypothetical protein
MVKTTYESSFHKKVVQNIVFKDFKMRKFKKLIGLAGPNISSYLLFIKKMGIKQAHIYENNNEQIINQVLDFKPIIPTTVIFEDILNAPVKDDTIYDLDFCCSILNAREQIKKFKNNAIITLSIRPFGLKKTINEFCKLISKNKTVINYNTKITNSYKMHLIILSNKKIYECYQYRDSTSMLTIKPQF